MQQKKKEKRKSFMWCARTNSHSAIDSSFYFCFSYSVLLNDFVFDGHYWGNCAEIKVLQATNIKKVKIYFSHHKRVSSSSSSSASNSNLPFSNGFVGMSMRSFAQHNLRCVEVMKKVKLKSNLSISFFFFSAAIVCLLVNETKNLPVKLI